MSKKIGVVVSGRGSNLQSIIDHIAEGKLNVEIAVVVSDHKEAFALERAAKAGIPTAVVERKGCKDKAEFEDKIDAALRDKGAEVVVLAGFMRILTGHFISRWENKIINIHPALLPSFKGVDAQGQAVDYGVKIAGCTVHFVDEGTDTGPIILQKAVPVFDDDTEETLAARILIEEHKALPEAIQLWADGKLTIKGRKVYVAK
ncbi:MAG: phosphoribosylglycinamide formyltransferase [Acidaminococcaceae bacterium]|nr:phosphoribosylglycinamide formyltransferase [Acidaminococcaceae bacterium]